MLIYSFFFIYFFEGGRACDIDVLLILHVVCFSVAGSPQKEAFTYCAKTSPPPIGSPLQLFTRDEPRSVYHRNITVSRRTFSQRGCSSSGAGIKRTAYKHLHQEKKKPRTVVHKR